MTHVKVIIAAPDGEVMEEFVAANVPKRRTFEEGPISLSQQIRDYLEHRFDVAENAVELAEFDKI